jgi:hypothetical protein
MLTLFAVVIVFLVLMFFILNATNSRRSDDPDFLHMLADGLERYNLERLHKNEFIQLRDREIQGNAFKLDWRWMLK